MQSYKHVHLSNILYIKYSWPIAYGNWKTDQNTKTMTIRSRSPDTYQTDMDTSQKRSFNASNIVVDLLLMVFKKYLNTKNK